MSTNPAAKSWCYTLNNYTENDVNMFKSFECNYQVIGYEVGENGVPHLQGYIVWKRNYRLTQLKKISPAAHWEIALSPDAGNYCMKGGKFDLIDNRKQGKRTDLSDAIATLRTDGIKKVKQDHPEVYVKFHAGLHKLVDKEPRNFKPMVYWIYGKTGVGKTKFVVENECDLWISGKNLRWWQGYDHQEAVLFDDFRADFCTFHELLRILDRYPYQVEVKGGSIELTAQRMYITSCYHPSEVYQTREDVGQLLRRIDAIREMKKGGILKELEVEDEDLLYDYAGNKYDPGNPFDLTF